MQAPDAETESIIEEIREAIRDVSQGSLSLHQAITATWADEKRVAAARVLDSDHHWEEIPDQHIENGAKALYGADPESWRYLYSSVYGLDAALFQDKRCLCFGSNNLHI